MKFYFSDNQHFYLYLDRQKNEVDSLKTQNLEAILQEEQTGETTEIKGILKVDQNCRTTKPSFVPPQAEFDWKNLKEIHLCLSQKDYDALTERELIVPRCLDTTYQIKIEDNTESMI